MDSNEASNLNHQVAPQQANDEKKTTVNGDKPITSSKKKLTYHATFWDVLSFGICVSSANIFIEWSVGFTSGYWDFLFACAISGSSFIALYLCVAEMVSILPLAGGSYALARATTGSYVGFLVGCCESVGNIIFAFIAMMPLGTTITYMFNGDPMYEPIYWLVIYLLVIGTEFAGRKVYFTFLRSVAFLSLSLLVLYIIVSVQDIRVDKYIPNMVANTYQGGIKEMLPLLPPAGWWYFGIEIMPLISDEVENAKVNSPRAIVFTVVIVTVFAFVCMLCAYAQYPSYPDDDGAPMRLLPLNSGFSNSFGISDQMATILSYPGLYISNALFIYGYGKQLQAMAKSRLLPSFLKHTLTATAIPYTALIFGSVVGYVVLVVLTKGYGYDYDSVLINQLFNATLLGRYFTFMIMLISFIIFRYKYSSLPRSFKNPFGIAGAVYGMIGFGFLGTSLIGFNDDEFMAFIFLVVFLSAISVYYFTYARYKQVFSEEEQADMFIVYLMKANQMKHHALKKKKKRNNSLGSAGGATIRKSITSPRNSVSSAGGSEADERESNPSVGGSDVPENVEAVSPSHSSHWKKFNRVHVAPPAKEENIQARKTSLVRNPEPIVEEPECLPSDSVSTRLGFGKSSKISENQSKSVQSSWKANEEQAMN